MLCTLRPVSNLLSLALRLTEHLHNLAVPKNRDTQTHPTTPHPQVPSSVSHGGRNTFRDSPSPHPFISLLPFSPSVSVSLYFCPCPAQSPQLKQTLGTHIHTNTNKNAHAWIYTPIPICMSCQFPLRPVFEG